MVLFVDFFLKCSPFLGLKHAPVLEELILTGCPLAVKPKYREQVLELLPNLQILDGIPVVLIFIFNFNIK
jgi:hypothetical protein